MSELKCILQKRECDTDSKKSILQARLRDVLIEEGEDLDTLEKLEDKITENSQKLADSLNNKITVNLQIKSIF